MFDPSQRSEALKQSNAIMRCFIGEFINIKILPSRYLIPGNQAFVARWKTGKKMASVTETHWFYMKK